MKKILCSLAAALFLCSGAFADEGMWLLPLLQKMNAQDMAAHGCRLTPEQIYSINNTSLKDAIVHFGGGCTGEMISKEGLLVTNHHCGYSSIQGLSTPEHNYLEDGYWAMKRDEELPVPGLTVTFLVNMRDVTDMLDKAYEKTLKKNKKLENAQELAEKEVKRLTEELVKGATEDYPNTTASVTSFYNDNVKYLIVYRVYRDVRFVGAPPASLGKFGGETDNWMWPRHTCDFSMFRVYADKDNMPAEYSKDNVPYTPAQALKVSLRGINEGDYAMIMGYPGRTQRFQTAPQLESMMGRYGISVKARTVRQNVMWEGMEADPVVRLQYANKYASSANGWKKWQGEQLAFDKLGIIPREKEKEAQFMAWVNQKKSRQEKYGKALEKIETALSETDEANKDVTLITESVYRIGLFPFISALLNTYAREMNGKTTDEAKEIALKKAVEVTAERYKDYSEPLERKIAVAMLEFYRDNAKKELYPSTIEDFEHADLKAYVDNLFETSMFDNEQKLREGVAQGGLDGVMADPATVLYMDVVQGKVMGLYPTANGKNDLIAEGSKEFTAGLLEWKKGEKSYPDANSTMRLTYGNVLPYSPKDGVSYWYYTTLNGVMEKEDPGNYEFRVPEKLKELYKAKDYGQYADASGQLPACFLTNNDITGGNSGSPVLDADGALIGLAFDGNWESMSSDVMFEPDLQRCICVDIRYVLFIMDKFGGAGHLLDEMEILR